MTSVKAEDGYRAWQKLRLRFEPGLAAKQGMIIAEFSGMVAKPAKSPQETVSLLTDMEKRMKMIVDITDAPISDIHAKSVLIGILDPMTRQHTTMWHASSYEELQQKVVEFANNATASSGPAPMQLDRMEMQQQCQDCNQQQAPQDWGDDGGGEGHLNPIGQYTKCYNCK